MGHEGWRTKSGKLLVASVGLLVATVAFHYALRDVSLAELKSIAHQVSTKWLLVGSGLYGAILTLRAVRWRLFLRQLKPIRSHLAHEGMIVGFAANYLMPARLGELFRADYMKRITALSRSSVVGTIGIERTLDGLTVLTLLTFGGALLIQVHPLEAGASDLVTHLLFAGALLFGIVVTAIVIVRLIRDRLSAVSNPLLQRVHMLTRGVRTLNRKTLVPAVALTLVIWGAEILMLSVVLGAFGVRLNLPQLMLLCACAALSTLAPTAPAFLGSMQLVFAKLLESFGETAGVGIAAASAVQIACYLPYALLGIIIGLSRWAILSQNRKQESGLQAEQSKSVARTL